MAAPCWRRLCTAWFPLVQSLFALACAVCVRVLFVLFELQAERVRLCWGGREAPLNERLLPPTTAAPARLMQFSAGACSYYCGCPPVRAIQTTQKQGCESEAGAEQLPPPPLSAPSTLRREKFWMSACMSRPLTAVNQRAPGWEIRCDQAASAVIGCRD